MKQSEKKPRAKKKQAASGPSVQGGSDQSRKIAAVVLEVLGGVLRPSEAARVLDVSVSRYYQIELRALEGLVKACEPCPKGRVANPAKQIVHLEQKIQRLENECMRFQSLARAAGRAVGVDLSSVEKTANGKRKRKPTVRALKMAQILSPRGDVVKEVK